MSLLLLAVVFVLFIAVDILTAKLLKIKRTAIRNISFALLCIFAVASGVCGSLMLLNGADATKKTLYNAYSYLLEGNVEKATENAAKVQSPHADIISLLADGLQGDYASAFINADDIRSNGNLNDDLFAQTEAIYELSRQMTGINGVSLSIEEAHEQYMGIADKCFAMLKVSGENEVEFLSGFRRDRMLNSNDFYEIDPHRLSEMLLEAPDDKELLQYSVKYYNATGGLDAAEENARKLFEANKTVENIVLYTDVIAQKLISDVSIISYDESDKEIAVLLEQAEEAEQNAESYDADNPRREENLIRAEDYRRQANGVKARRIINWLTAQTPLFGDRSGIIDLQLSKLYSASGNDTEAREILMSLLERMDKISDTSPIKNALMELDGVYYDASASDEEISAAINAVLSVDVFLPDSVLNRGYSQFLNNLLKYERVSVFISSVNAENFPIVRTYLNVNGKKDGVEELANDFVLDDFSFSDNGFEIPIANVKRIEDDSSNFVSIALVVDGSGSMGGERITNARRAVESCISNMRPETQELSIVLYDDNGVVLTPLTNDENALEQGASQINANGGTTISSGMMAGLETLEDVNGTKAIILMTDGEDGSPETMDTAIEAAQEANVAVFTISTGGGDREYMENIAEQTGGSYMEAVTDNELINVYTALQNYIVNNYCFEFTVLDDTVSNPRILTVGIEDYMVSSSRLYSYGGLVLSKDGSYITRGDSGSLRLLYAEPSVVSVNDAEYGVPIFISAEGVTDGAKVFVNGNEVSDVKIVENSAVMFTLSGKYSQGTLNISIRLPDGTVRSTDKLVSVAELSGGALRGQSITLGNGGNTLYANNIEQTDDYTLKLSGNIVLNGFLRTDKGVSVQSDTPIALNTGRLTINSGSISGTGAAYVDFSSSADANYGQLALSGRSVQIMDSFNFYFDENGVSMNNASAALSLPGFGEMYGEARYNGSELTVTINGGALPELQANINYALNGMPMPLNSTNTAAQIITGYSQQGQTSANNGHGMNVNAGTLTVVIRKDYMSIVGDGTVNGSLGLIDVFDGRLMIDTNNIASMFEIEAMASFDSINDAFGVNGQSPLTMTASAWYPDELLLNTTGFSINAAGLSECFTNATPPKPLEGVLNVNYPIAIADEPYSRQISSLLKDISLSGDLIEFICAADKNQSGIKVYSSADPNQYVKFMSDRIVIPINDIDEISLFGSDMGGEISGTAVISDRQIEISIDVDGHFDNAYFGVKHDGKANFTAALPRNARADTAVTIAVTYNDISLSYNSTATGNISPENGFNTYAEDDSQ